MLKAAKLLIAISFTAVLTCCSESSEEYAKREGENGIRRILKDPDSAEFRDEVVSTETTKDAVKDRTVCGYVNSKNSFGAYTGFTRFVVHVIGETAIASEGDNVVGAVIEEGDMATRYPGGTGTYFANMVWRKTCNGAR